jgi:hypothetical protein
VDRTYPGVEQSLKNVYADEANWPASFTRPLSEAVNAFLGQAAQALEKAKPLRLTSDEQNQ